MDRQRSFKVEVIQVIISVLIAVVAGVDMIGEPARLPLVLTLTLSSISAGIGVGRLIEKRRSRRLIDSEDASADSVPKKEPERVSTP